MTVHGESTGEPRAGLMDALRGFDLICWIIQQSADCSDQSGSVQDGEGSVALYFTSVHILCFSIQPLIKMTGHTNMMLQQVTLSPCVDHWMLQV